MKIQVTLFALVIAFLSACSPQYQATTPQPRGVSNDRLLCGYSNHYFRVSDGIHKWEKYVSNMGNQEPKVECGEKIAAALIGPYFVFFSNGQIKDRYVGTFPESRRILSMGGEMAAAVMGGYFLTGSDAGGIVEKHVGSSASLIPAIAVSKNLAVAVMGSYFVVSDGTRIIEKFVGPGAGAKAVAGSSMAAALVGNYFVAYIDGEIKEKYIGTRSEDDVLDRGRVLMAASMGNYFVVLDSQRKLIRENYVGSAGRVQIIGNIAVHLSKNGTQTRYNLETGTFY